MSLNATDWKFVHELIERISSEAYALGYKQASDGKPSEQDKLKLTKANKVSLQTAYNKHTNPERKK
jgi:hypothetical protein